MSLGHSGCHIRRSQTGQLQMKGCAWRWLADAGDKCQVRGVQAEAQGKGVVYGKKYEKI